MEGISSAAIMAVLALLYFLPAVIAGGRKHRNTGPIFIVNLFFGWTFLGWVGALAWAFSANVATKV